jgi:HSP20 family protein
MLGYPLSDFERTFNAMDELRQRLGRVVFGDVDARAFSPDTSWPRTSVYETKEALVLVAEVPGLTEKDLEITLKDDVLTLAGARKLAAPEGYQVHRQERRGTRFERSFTLPYHLDTERLGAELKDGILTVTLPKVPEVQPRKIQIKTA